MQGIWVEVFNHCCSLFGQRHMSAIKKRAITNIIAMRVAPNREISLPPNGSFV